MQRKRRRESSLFEEFMEYVKKKKADSPSSESSESDWPVEYLDDSFEDTEQEREEKQKGGKQYQEEESEEEQKNVKEEKIVIEEELDEELLKLLGKEKENNLEKTPKIHEELAKRWNNVIEKGIEKEEKLNILKKYPPIENMPRLVTPKINPEAEAAMSDPAKKRDRSISTKQKQVAVAISALGSLLSNIISNKEYIESSKNDIISKISDAGRILCDLFYEENKIRRYCALESLNKELRHSLQQREPEEFLFGKNLSEGIRTAKAVAKAAQDLKIKTQSKGRNLNRQGPLRSNNHQHQYQGRNNAGQGLVQKRPNTSHTQRKRETQQKQSPRSRYQRTRTHH